jgi:hypothetical protein
MNTSIQLSIQREIIEHLNECVLFVGQELYDEQNEYRLLAAELIDRCQAHEGCINSSCTKNNKCQNPENCIIPLPKAAQFFEARNNRQALIEFVDSRISRFNTPGALHQAIANLPVRIIITTSWDDRLETALKDLGKKVLPVVKDTDLPFDDPYRVQLIYLNGVLRQPDSLVLTEEDTADLFTRLPLVTRVLQAHFASKTILFIGYKLDDYLFLSLYRSVTVAVTRYNRMAYALQWPESSLVIDCWNNKIKIISTPPLPFLQQIARSARTKKVQVSRLDLPKEPYKFLDYYTREDQAIFFGRALEVDLLLSIVLAHSLTVFYGQSGCGKTSLLRARLIPALEEEGFLVVYVRMLGDPVTEVKAAVRGVRTQDLSAIDQRNSLSNLLGEVVSVAGRIAIILDQFEEFFIRQGEAVRREFAKEMANCLSNSLRDNREEGGIEIHFLFSLRDDYLGPLDELNKYLTKDIFSYRFRLENLTSEKARLAIVKPAELFNLQIEQDLVDRLVSDLEDHGLETTNLQIILFRLYQDALEEEGLKKKTTISYTKGLTLAKYLTLGGARAILGKYLDEVLAKLSENSQEKARTILKSMVTAEQTRSVVSSKQIARDELVSQMSIIESELDELLDYLRDRRIVRKFGEEEHYELAHEVLVEKVWEWISNDELRSLETRDMLRRALNDFQKFGHTLSGEKFKLIDNFREVIHPNVEELELLLRSALETGINANYWYKKLESVNINAKDIVLEGIRSDDFRTRINSARRLAQFGELFVNVITSLLLDDYPQVRITAISILENLLPSREWQTNLKYERYIPAGSFVMGEGELAHEVTLDAFYISRTPVTNLEYKQFSVDQGKIFEFPQGKEHHPVIAIDWHQAQKYAEWSSMRLLTEAEWEKAASWQEDIKVLAQSGRLSYQKRKYPWGNGYDYHACNTKETGIGDTTPVAKFSPQGDSFYGCADLAGNIWEWTSSLRRAFPYNSDDGREEPTAKGLRVLRGGSWYDVKEFACCIYRANGNPDNKSNLYGFRCGWSMKLIILEK